MSLRFYNTLSQQVEEFRPQEDNIVRMYTCGPTVYDYAHIGNFRTFVFFDLLRRWLRERGYRLDHVMNITDVEDKIIRNALAQHKSLTDYTAKLIKDAYWEVPFGYSGIITGIWASATGAARVTEYT